MKPERLEDIKKAIKGLDVSIHISDGLPIMVCGEEMLLFCGELLDHIAKLEKNSVNAELVTHNAEFAVICEKQEERIAELEAALGKATKALVVIRTNHALPRNHRQGTTAGTCNAGLENAAEVLGRGKR